MLELYTNKLPPIFQGRYFNNDIEYCRKYYSKVIQDLEHYSNDISMTAQNEHILCRLLNRFTNPDGIDNMDYYMYIDEESSYIPKELNMSTMHNKGQWFFNNMFNGSKEAYYVYINPIPVIHIDKDWRNYQPVTILYTSNSTLDITIPNYLLKRRIEMVMVIDIYKLLFQYKYWRANRINRELNPSAVHYLTSFLFPRMLPSYIEYSLFNVFCNMVHSDVRDIEFYTNLPYSISNYDRKLINGYKDIIKKFKDTKQTYGKLMENLPTMFYNGYEFLKLPESWYTRQLIWLPIYSRVNATISLIDLLGTSGKIYNSDYIATLRKSIREYKNYGDILPSNTPSDIKRNMYAGLDLIASFT